MLNDKKIVVVMPAYNAAQTVEKTFQALPDGVVDEVVLVDDCSSDATAEVASRLGIQHVLVHPSNLGYGGNQKSCYKKALELGADVVVMVHPDYQYEPKLVTAMASPIAEGIFDCMLGSRILGTGALKGGMPIYKYIANRLLTLFQNLLIPYKLSEYHTGYRAFSRTVLEQLPLELNSNNFLFDNQMLVQVIGSGYRVGEVTCSTRYMTDSSSIDLANSIEYGLGVILTTVTYRLSKLKLLKCERFSNLSRPQFKQDLD